MRDAVSLVLKDEGFKLPSPQAKTAYLCGEKFYIWLSVSSNSSKVYSFAKNLVYHIQGCVVESCHSRSRERMWENYYKLRSSGEFRDMWTIFLCNSINVEASPIFYQFVSDSILDVFINMNIAVTSAGANTVLPIDYIEANAIRYVAGYVVRAVKKKCMRSAHPLKEQIVLCLCDMEEDIGKIISSCNIILLDVLYFFLLS